MLHPVYKFKNKSLNLLKHRQIVGPPCRCPCLYCQSLASGCKNPAANLLMSLFWQDCISHCLLIHRVVAWIMQHFWNWRGSIQEAISKTICKHNLESDSLDSQSSLNIWGRTVIFLCTAILFHSKLLESSVHWDKFILGIILMKWVKSHQGFIWLITNIFSFTSMLCICQLTHCAVMKTETVSSAFQAPLSFPWQTVFLLFTFIFFFKYEYCGLKRVWKLGNINTII